MCKWGRRFPGTHCSKRSPGPSGDQQLIPPLPQPQRWEQMRRGKNQQLITQNLIYSKKKKVHQHEVSVGEESFSKTYSRPILICWKYLQVTSLSLRSPWSAGCLHDHAAPHHWGSPQEKSHQSLARCQFMIITINRVLLTTTSNPFPHIF